MHVMATVLAALAGAAVLERLNVPAGALIGAMVGVAALNLTSGLVWPLPESGQFLAFAGIGWLLGQGITAESVRLVSRSPGVILGSVAFLLAASSALAYALTRAHLLDPATAFLATSPGGLSQMSALAAAVFANAPMVVTIHLLRVITVVVMAPVVIRWLGR